MARRIDNPEIVPGSGRHRTNRTVAKRDARAWVDVPVKPGPQFSLEE